MSFQDYVRHMKLKYRLATALAVAKSKPENVTIEEYITSLQNKLKPDAQMDVDLDFSLGSDDFAIDDDFSPQMEGNENTLTPTHLLTQGTVESPTILRDFQPDILLQSNNEPSLVDGGQIETFSVEEALEFLDHWDAEERQHVQRPPYHFGTNTETITNDTEMILFNNTTQATDKTKFLRENITKFVDNMETMNNKTASVNNLTTNKELAVNTAVDNTLQENVKRALQQVEDRVQTQATDTQATELYSMSDYTQNTHFSQSQRENTNRLDNLDKYIKSNKQTEISTKNPEASKEISHAQTTSKDNDEYGTTQDDYLNMDLEIGKNYDAKLIKFGNNSFANKTKEGNVNLVKTNAAKQTQEETNRITHEELQITVEINANAEEITDAHKNSTRVQENSQMQLENDSEDDIFDSQSETTIPFKIIEELNKVKAIVSGRNERKISTDSFSTDSGYKSDSQKKSTKTGLQSSITWLNQSAHTLFDYLISCPLVSSTSEITSEISQVLGDLIDKLHSDEKYPSFLDQVLETIDSLLEQLSGRVDCWDSVITKKDESIHRILLLNTSIHIITSTVEKITTKLVNLHANIKREGDIYEITHLETAENAVYIFHTLERLLQRYLKKKQLLSSQFTPQLTDDDKTPKRSSLTEFWKQKWDPEFKTKDSILNLDADVKCVDTKVGEILNKLVIDCMEGYSLVAFAALQCFNVLQS